MSEAALTSKKNKMIILIVSASVVGVALLAACIFFFVSSIVGRFTEHPAYQMATDRIRESSDVAAVIGKVESFGFPMGNISTSPGGGSANFDIRVRGTEGEVRVLVELRRSGGDWEITSFALVQQIE